MKYMLILSQLNHGCRAVWTMKFPVVVMFLLISLCQGCFESAGEKAAQILSKEVIPQLTGESEQWRKLANETMEKLPSEFRHEFDLIITRAVAAGGVQYQCGVDFVRTRLRQDLESLQEEWLGTGSGPLLMPVVCSIYPDHSIKLDQNGRPKDQETLVFYGYDLMDYNNRPLVRVWLEYTDGRREDITQCCLNNPTHFNLTVNFSEIRFANVRRIVLVRENGQDWQTVGVDHLPSVAPTAPTVIRRYQLVEGGDYQESGMIACSPGYAMAGFDEENNNLLCRRVMPEGEETFIETSVDSGTVRLGMHACPQGTYMRGVHIEDNRYLCSWDSRHRPEYQREFEDRGSQDEGMHACPRVGGYPTYMTGLHADENRFLCGEHYRQDTP